MLTTPFALVQDAEDQAAALIERGDLDNALAIIIGNVDSLVPRADLTGRALFLPLFDQLLLEISERIAQQVIPDGLMAAAGCQLIVATETYNTGGHSRVIEDLCRHLARPVIVLTDLFGRMGSAALPLDYLYRDAGAAAVLTLPPGRPLERAINLLRLVAQLAPERILMLTHHQDAIAYAALASRRLKVPRAFVHHADHNPSLGGTLDHFHHVDLVREIGAACASALQRDVGHLPLHVRDLGARPQPGRAVAQASIATCGAMRKYARRGELAYQSIVATACKTLGGIFHHIGPMPEDWVTEIRDHLRQMGLSPERFQVTGQVPSLWRCLMELDVDVYLASAPMGGGRAAIEAQGCGCPFVYYQHDPAAHPLFTTEVYNPAAPSWSNLDELQAALLRAATQAGALSQASRNFYEAGFGGADYSAAIARMAARSDALVD